jgi:8-hydroxy-5-deazaflavin:NADPH oxidoreductase
LISTYYLTGNRIGKTATERQTMNIAIIGSGNVGKHLASGLQTFGHKTFLGTRDASKLEEFKTANTNVGIGSYAEAAQFADLVILTVNFDGMPNTLELAGATNLAGKVVIDASNPLEFSTGKPALALGWNTSAGESVQNWLPKSHVVKALSACGKNSMLKPQTAIGGKPDMPIAGNSLEAKQTVSTLLEGLGWGVVDLGDITLSRLIEPMTLIGILDNFRTGWQKDNQGWQLVNVARSSA